MFATRRRMANRATTHHGHPGAARHDMSTPRACPNGSSAPFALLCLHRAQRQAAVASPFLTERCHRLARSPLQKRVGHLAPSFVVISSPSSTFLSGRLRLGKGVFAISSTAAMAGPRRSWRSMRPTATAAFPSPLPCLFRSVVNSKSLYRA